MANGDITPAGTLGIDVVANVAEFERTAGPQLKASAEKIGRETGKTMGDAMNRGAAEGSGGGSRGAQALAMQRGREMARAQADALIAQFRLDQARIKDGMARGFLSPAEAQKAGREAAQGFNAGMVGVLDRGAASGAFRGKAGRELFTDLAGSIKTVGTESRRAGLGIGELRESFGSVLAQAAGVHPIFGRISNVLGSFALGGTIMVGVLLGLTALAKAWQLVTDPAKKAKEAFEGALEAARSARLERETQGDIDLIQQTEILKKERDRLIAEVQAEAAGTPELARRRAGRALAHLPGVTAGDIATQIAAETKSIESNLQARRDRIAEINREIESNDLALADQRKKRLDDEAEEAKRALEKRLAEEKRVHEERMRLVEEWRVSQLTDLDRQIELLNKMAAAADALGKADFSATMRRQVTELERQKKVLEDLLKLTERAVPARLATGSTPAGSALGIRPSVGASLVGTQQELAAEMSRLQVLRAAGKITEQELKDGVAAAAREANSQLLRLLNSFSEMGLIAPEALQEIIKLLQGTGDEADTSAEKVADIADTFARVARGVLSVVQALGALSREEEQALQGAIDLAEGIASIGKDPIGGTIQAIGGLVKLGTAIFGESESEKENRDILKRNNDALERLTLEIKGFRVDMNTVSRAITAIETFRTQGKFQQWLSATTTGTIPGLGGAELDAIADRFGIQIRDANGNLVPGALDQLLRAMKADQATGGVIAGGGAAQVDRLSVSMTVVQGNRLIDLMASSTDHLRAIRQALTGTTVALPSIGGAATGSPLIGAVNVNVGGDGISVANAEQIGQKIGAGIVRALPERARDAHAAHGFKGSVSLEVRS
jgi:hypothetical protein